MSKFDFSKDCVRQPATLSTKMPYMTPTARKLVEDYLQIGCDCGSVEPPTARIKRRKAIGVSIWLQCDACGHSLGSAMPRAEHPGFLDYPLWDTNLPESFEKLRQEYHENRRAEASLAFPVILGRSPGYYAARRAEYREWCRTSPEWAALTKLVGRRSRGHCEACLNATAEVVHHLTYEFGKLPPAWHLRAVCRACHARLHTGGDDWCGSGMAREPAE